MVFREKRTDTFEIRGIKQSLDICVVLNHFIEAKNGIVKLYCF